MERLTLPKKMSWARDKLGEVAKPGIPPGSLPRCAELPLDRKLPMAPGPKDAVLLFTTYIGEKIQDRSLELDFDLTDPYSLLMSNNYKPLHDPHLKPHLATPKMRRRLRRAGFITRDQRVLCTLKEFNEYRQYLRKINLALDRKKEEERTHDAMPVRKRRTSEALSMAKMREERLRVVRERLKQQYEEDRARCQQIIQEEEARRVRVRDEQKARQTDIEKKFQVIQERRVNLLKRRQYEECQRRMLLMDRWLEEEDRRALIADTRRREKDEQRHRQMAESWDQRRQVQQMHLDKENEMRIRADKMKQERIESRRREARLLKEQREELLRRACEARRQEKLQLEEDYARRFQHKMQERNRLRRRRLTSKKKKGRGAGGYLLKSNWNLERALLSSLSDDEGVRHTRDYGLLDSGVQGMKPPSNVQRMASSLGLGDFHGACFDRQSLLELRGTEASTRETSSKLGLGDFRGACFTKDSATTKAEQQLDEALKSIPLGEFHGATFTKSPSAIRLEAEDPEHKANVEALVDLVMEEKIQREEMIDQAIAAEYRGAVTKQHSVEELAKSKTQLTRRAMADSLVSIWLYLSAQVLAPAIDKYEQEELAERPPTPTPTSKESKKVRFSFVNETIETELLDEMSGLARGMRAGDADDDDEGGLIQIVPAPDSDGRTDSDDSDDGAELRTDSDMLIKLDGRDSLTRLRKASIAAGAMPFDALPLSYSSAEAPILSHLGQILKKILDDFNDGNLSSDQVRKLVFVAKEIMGDRVSAVISPSSPSRSESPTSSQSNATSLLAERIIKDVLDRVKATLFREKGEQEAEEKSETTAYMECANRLTQYIIEKSLGLFAASLLNLSDEVISSSRVGSRKSSAVRVSSITKLSDKADETSPRDSTGSGTSGATDFIHSVLGQVLHDLGEIELTSPRISLGSDFSGMSVASDFIRGVFDKVMKDLGSKQSPRESLTSKDSPRESDASEPSTTSGATDFVNQVLNKVVTDVEAEPIVPQYPSREKHPVKSVSTTSDFVKEVLGKALDDITASVVEQATTSGRSSLTSMVLGTLEKVVMEIEYGREPSETSMFISDILKRATSEIQQIRPTSPVQSKPSDASLRAASSTSLFIREALGRVITELEAETKSPAPAKAVSSVFAENLVHETLQKCLKDLRSPQPNTECLTELASAILTSSQSASKTKLKAASPTGRVQMSRSLDAGIAKSSQSRDASMEATSSVLVEELIRETLTRVQRQMDEGTLSSEYINELASQIRSMTGTPEISPRSETSSQEAEDIVRDAIAHVLGEIELENYGPDVYKDIPISAEAADPNSLPMQHMLETFLKHLMSDIDVDDQQQQDLDQGGHQKRSAGQANQPDQQQQQQQQPQEPAQGEQQDSQQQPQEGTDENSQSHEPPSDSDPDDENNDDVGAAGATDRDMNLTPHPVIGDEELDVDPEVMNETLLSISAKEPRFAMPNDNTARNSFCNLSRPDVSQIQQLDTSSKQSIKQSLVSLSSRTLAMRGSKLLESVPSPTVATVKKSLPRRNSEFMPRSSVQRNINEDDEDDDWNDVESDDSDEIGDRLVSVSNMAEPDTRDNDTAGSSAPAQPPSVRSMKAVGPAQSSPLNAVKASKSASKSITSPPGSGVARQPQAKTSKPLKDAEKTSSRPLSPYAITAAYGSPKSSKTELSAKKSTERHSAKTSRSQRDAAAEVSSTRTKASRSKRSVESFTGTFSKSRNDVSPGQTPTTSRSLMLPRKSTEPLACSDHVKLGGTVTSAGSIQDTEEVKAADSTQSLESSPDVKPAAKPLRSTNSLGGKSGRTIELTSSLSSTKRATPKASKNEVKNKGSLHKSMNLTPRPSSAFGNTHGSKTGVPSSSNIKASPSKERSQLSLRRSSQPKMASSMTNPGQGPISPSRSGQHKSADDVKGSTSATGSPATAADNKPGSLPDVTQQ